jgi:hypothetical protein
LLLQLEVWRDNAAFAIRKCQPVLLTPHLLVAFWDRFHRFFSLHGRLSGGQETYRIVMAKAGAQQCPCHSFAPFHSCPGPC